MAINPLDLPELLRNAPAGIPKTVNNLHTISDVTEQATTSLRVLRGSYAFPWPDAVEGLGLLRVGPFGPCHKCGVGSWARYGTTVLCLVCAKGANGY